ncbi:hypothetical protein, partial [Leptolyngbya sp. FACHB-36]|uniref:hypothetical protein n=1 Tax=Leptolyngbya sp. FACHB-36 TaxID=2692808 RepID=UPI001A7E85EA
LKQAQASASRDQIADAMNGISGIPKNSRHYEMAQRLQEDWSRELLRQATNYCRQAKVETAVSMLSTIPATSQLHDRVTELRQRWSKQAKVLDQAIAAKDAEDWQQAISAIKSLEGSPMYHSLPVQELLQQAMTNLYEPEESLTEIATSDLPAVELSDELQQPDQVLVEIATQDLPTVQPSITPPEKISVSPAPTQQAF